MFLNCELCEALKSLKDWTLVGSFAVGGFEYMGFSISDSNKLIVISSDRETVFDSRDGSITDIEAVIDETKFQAMVDILTRLPKYRKPNNVKETTGLYALLFLLF